MSPFAIDESRMKAGSAEQLITLDPAKPPTKSIPHCEFPRVVYKHPVIAFRTIEHRNAKHELVDEEVVPNEHLTKAVACRDHLAATSHEPCKKCDEALKKALAEGWVLEPFISEAPEDPTAAIYDSGKSA